MGTVHGTNPSADGETIGRLHGSLSDPFARTSEDDPEVHVPFIANQSTKKSAAAKPWTPLMIVTGLSTMFGSAFCTGYNIGILNSPQQIIVNFCNASILYEYGYVIEATPLNLVWSFVVSIFLIGGGIGAMLGGTLADKIGRKNSLLVIVIMNIVSAVLFGTCSLARSMEMLLLGRFIVGVAAGMSTSFMPVYMAEISTAAAQNFLGILCPGGITFGLVVGQILSLEFILGNEEGWNVLLALNAVPALSSLVFWFTLPESPRYLFVMKQNKDKAMKELCRLRGCSSEELTKEMEILNTELYESTNSSRGKDQWTLKNIWAEGHLRMMLICVIVLHLGNQLSGINAVFYYSTHIFKSAGLSSSQAEYANVGAGIINMIMNFSAIFLTRKFRRRILMFISTIGSSICLICLTVTIMFVLEVSWMPYMCVVSLLLYVLFFGIGIGPLPFFLPSELIPPGPRPFVMSLGCMINWAMNFAIGMSFPSIQSVIGVYTFIIFAAATILQAVFLYFKLPETLHSTAWMKSGAIN